MIKARLAEGKGDEDLLRLEEAIRALESPGNGWIRSTAARDQKDPSWLHFWIMFESEEAARARESDPSRAEGLAKVVELMDDLLDGPREFTDLTVVYESHND